MRISELVRLKLAEIEAARTRCAELHFEISHERYAGQVDGILWMADVIGLDRGDLGLPAGAPIERGLLPGESS